MHSGYSVSHCKSAQRSRCCCYPILPTTERKKHRVPTPVTQYGSAELRLELAGFWAYPVTTAREGKDVTEGTVRWTLGEVVLGRYGVVIVYKEPW